MVPLRSCRHGSVTMGALWLCRLAPGISYPSIPSSSLHVLSVPMNAVAVVFNNNNNNVKGKFLAIVNF